MEQAPKKASKTFLVTIGYYEDKTYYIVRGANDTGDAESQVTTWYKETYGPDWWMDDVSSVEEIQIKKGVTRL